MHDVYKTLQMHPTHRCPPCLFSTIQYLVSLGQISNWGVTGVIGAIIETRFQASLFDVICSLRSQTLPATPVCFALASLAFSFRVAVNSLWLHAEYLLQVYTVASVDMFFLPL